jgi:hypothetical protein
MSTTWASRYFASRPNDLTPQRKWLLKLAVVVSLTRALCSQLKPFFVILIGREVNVQFLCRIKHHTNKVHGVEIQTHAFLISVRVEVSDTFQDPTAWPTAKRHLQSFSRRLNVPYPVWAIWRREKSLSVLVIELNIRGGDWACKFPRIRSGTYWKQENNVKSVFSKCSTIHETALRFGRLASFTALPFW